MLTIYSIKYKGHFDMKLGGYPMWTKLKILCLVKFMTRWYKNMRDIRTLDLGWDCWSVVLERPAEEDKENRKVKKHGFKNKVD